MPLQNNGKLVVSIAGMHCPSCALGIEKYLNRLPGITGTSVNFIKQEAVVNYDSSRITPDAIKKAISKTGYSVKETLIERTKAYWDARIFWLRVVFTAILIIISWILAFLPSANPGVTQIISHTFSLADILSLTAIAVGGYPVFRGAYKSLILRDITVFSLIAIASIAAVLVGSYKEAAMVILIMLVGEALEQSALGRTRRAIAELLHLTPQTALVRRQGNDISVRVEDLAVGDVIVIKLGDRIPVDGVIVKGEGSINEATLTGESLCIDKKTDDTVYSGTLNESGAFEMRATAIGEHTRLGLIKRLIEEAESQKAPVQRLADKYVNYFFPLVIVISLAMYFITDSYYAAITVLVAACPCALVLATPTAVVCGLSNAARRGILIKGGQYLELLGTVSHILMDKTGTLTTGRLSVNEISPLAGIDEKELIRLAATAENNSEHPLARAIVARARALDIQPAATDNFKSARGLGVRAALGDVIIWVGNKKWLEMNNIAINQDILNKSDNIANSGQTVILVAIEKKDGSGVSIIGLMGIKDIPRPIAAQSLKAIRELGIKKIIMITGDNDRVAQSISREVGIDEFYAGMLPDEKVDKITRLKQEGHTVAMVGDGVNDAPALAAADVGIAMAAIGSPVAIESADVSLMSDDLGKIPLAIKLSRQVRAIIKQNFIFAIIYNIAIISATGLYAHHQSGITFGALAHQVSSLAVIINSLRLLKWSR
jgi:Cd2+/Zn2+-exporting ATPase